MLFLMFKLYDQILVLFKRRFSKWRLWLSACQPESAINEIFFVSLKVDYVTDSVKKNRDNVLFGMQFSSITFTKGKITFSYEVQEIKFIKLTTSKSIKQGVKYSTSCLTAIKLVDLPKVSTDLTKKPPNLCTWAGSVRSFINKHYL